MVKKIPLFLIILLLITIISLNTYSYTSLPKEVKCPVCGEKFNVHITASMSVRGSYADFQRHGAIGNYYESIIYGCKKCHFCGTFKDFSQTVAEEIKTKVLAELKPYKPGQNLEEYEECDFSARIYIWQKKRNFNIADTYLVGSYLLKKRSNLQDKRKEFQKLAIQYFEKAISSNEISQRDLPIIQYLIGELNRRLGNFDTAIKRIEEAKKNNANLPVWLKELMEKQLKLAKKRDDNNEV